MSARGKGRLRAGARMWKVAAGIGGLAAMVVWTSGACRSRIEPGRVEVARGLPVPDGAERFTVRVEPVAPRIDVVGTVTSKERVHLSARIPAYVSRVAASAGDAVTRGAVLVTLDDRELREQLSAAESQLKRAESEFQRTQRLFETKAATEQALQAAESAFSGARAGVERAKVMLTYTEIASPIDGIVIERRIEVGDLANPGQVLLSVYDPTRMQLEADVPVRLIDKLALGQAVDVVLDYPASSLSGKVDEIVSEVDPASRTRRVRIMLQSPPGQILPGTFGRVWVREDPHPCVCVPAGAVYHVGQLAFTQVVEGGRAVRRLVKAGPEREGRREILAGLADGEQVLSSPLQED